MSRPPFSWTGRPDWWKPALIGAIVLFFIGRLIIIVPAGERVVIFNAFTGVEPRVLSEGMNVLLPFVQSPMYYDVRTQTYTMSGTTDEGERTGDDAVQVLTADGQTVKMDISLRYHLVPGEVWKLHQQVGPSYNEKIIRPESRSVVRNVVSAHTVTEVYSSQRDQIQGQMADSMRKSLAKYYIALDELLIRNVKFSEQFATAIEQKQVALQDAERMKYVLQKEEAEKQRKIIEATGEAEAIRRRAEALRMNPQLIQYEYVQKLAPGVQAVITDQKTIMSFSDLFKSAPKKGD